MLKPAILYKDKIERCFMNKYFTKEMLFYSGSNNNYVPEIQTDCDNGLYQFAILDNDNNLIGYLSYRINFYESQAYNFGVISFCDKPNIIIAEELHNTIEYLLEDLKLHRIEYLMISGNHVERSYDTLCKKYNGRKLILKDCLKDEFGNYHDRIIYEILRKEDVE